MADNSASSALEKLCTYTRETALLSSVESLLGWDERTKMPTQAGAYRAEQITYLSGLIHRRTTASCVGEWLQELAGQEFDPHGDEGTVVRQLSRDYERNCKLPTELVEALAKETVIGQQVWSQARQNNDFASFAPQLKKIVALKQEQAAALGFEDHPYDALLDEYEPGASTGEVDSTLSALREQLVPLIQSIVESSTAAPRSILERDYPVAAQEQFATKVSAELGFDYQRGRLDVTDHPFCSSMGPSDCRITTRFDSNFFSMAFFGTLHEAGHGMYDQGLRSEWYGLPPGSYLSLGIHESQSRLWENMVGRSLPFWKYCYPTAQATFPTALGGVSLEDFYFAVNDVQPSLIRVEADEATYNLHIIIRFELEQELLTNQIQIEDLPSAWNDRYQQYLGIRPDSDANGVLQDIHWSAGLFGYFPTYALGNLYAAQFFAKADQQLGGMTALLERGEFDPLLEWLREQVHRPGQCYPASSLVERVTGEPLQHGYLVDYLRAKYEPLYLAVS